MPVSIVSRVPRACSGPPARAAYFVEKVTDMVTGADARLVAPCVLVSVTKYVYVVLFLTLGSVNVVTGGVPVIPFGAVMSVNSAEFASTLAGVGKEPVARQMSYLPTLHGAPGAVQFRTTALLLF